MWFLVRVQMRGPPIARLASHASLGWREDFIQLRRGEAQEGGRAEGELVEQLALRRGHAACHGLAGRGLRVKTIGLLGRWEACNGVTRDVSAIRGSVSSHDDDTRQCTGPP